MKSTLCAGLLYIVMGLVPASAQELDGTIAALQGGPQNADEELALEFVMDFGLGLDFANMLGFAAVQAPETQALIEKHGSDVVFAALGQPVGQAVAEYDPHWRLLIARALLTQFTRAELRSYMVEGDQSPYAGKIQSVDLSEVVGPPSQILLNEVSGAVVAVLDAHIAAGEPASTP